MNTGKWTVVALGLACAVGLAVSVAAQGSQEKQERQRRPRLMMLDGRGGQIGVVLHDVTEGVRVEEVDQDSPAAKAGLQTGDIVVEVDGERVRSARQFSRLIQETADGRSVALEIMRDGDRQTVTVTPESRGAGFSFDGGRWEREIAKGLRDLEPRMREFHFDFDGLPWFTSPRGRLGVQLNELTPQLADYFGATNGGVLVTSVTTGSPADKAGLRAGDVITTIAGGRVQRTDDVIDEVRDKEGDVTIGILRDKKESTLKVTIEAVKPPAGFRRPA